MTSEQWERFKRAYSFVPATDEGLHVLLASALRDALDDAEHRALTGSDEPWWPECDEDMLRACELYTRNRGYDE